MAGKEARKDSAVSARAVCSVGIYIYFFRLRLRQSILSACHAPKIAIFYAPVHAFVSKLRASFDCISNNRSVYRGFFDFSFSTLSLAWAMQIKFNIFFSTHIQMEQTHTQTAHTHRQSTFTHTHPHRDSQGTHTLGKCDWQKFFRCRWAKFLPRCKNCLLCKE